MKWRGLSSADGGPTVVAGIAQCENFLSWHAAISDAKAAAETFADRMPWLTTAQRREVLRTREQSHGLYGLTAIGRGRTLVIGAKFKQIGVLLDAGLCARHTDHLP
ncbi:hypothetical protein OIE69_00875 [Actinacidiphila glaucinigra]|uniref:hypothetical protein n=1 Tax=Actinacidiphila glaucinigra TaxID=235986 RepID=UPI002DDB8D3B|nr:hypothetical protein [Actinacidiphila glaucinigra]WSD57595.1 hypothetical protein OIE69_00875 [Actinacidiphila glaucinigra]